MNNRVIQIAIGIAQGLEAAQRVGLIHGDVKPSNILVDREGVPQLLDFGIARVPGQGYRPERFTARPITSPQRSPKHAISTCDPTSTASAPHMYHLLTGEYPFEGKNTKQIVTARLLRPARDVREAVPSISRATAKIVARMMKAKPDERYSTYEHLLQDLSAVIAGDQGPVMTEGTRRVGRRRGSGLIHRK